MRRGSGVHTLHPKAAAVREEGFQPLSTERTGTRERGKAWSFRMQWKEEPDNPL